MAREYRFRQVDVFTDRIFGGNPLAVVLAAEGISDEEMQAIGREMNLSETTFILPPSRPEYAAHVRIFTPSRELPFAGHPTIGTSYVLADEGLLPAGAQSIVLEEGIGPVPVRFEGDSARPTFAWMRHGDAEFEAPLLDRAGIAESLGLTEADLIPEVPIEVGSTGLPHIYVPLRDRATVDRAWVNLPRLIEAVGAPKPYGVFVLAPDADPAAGKVYSRMFAPQDGIAEDPATGSASGPLGAYLVRHGLVTARDEVQIVSEQGTKMGRQSFIHIRLRMDGGQPGSIEVGGSTVPVLDGVLRLR
jgi:trans-2,3-dihydro-3-hydroxyanthranilate isomerase